MVFLILLLLNISCKSKEIVTDNIASQVIVCGKCQGSGEEKFCPMCASIGQVTPNPQGGRDWAVGICPMCNGNGQAIVRPCRKCNGTGEILLANPPRNQ